MFHCGGDILSDILQGSYVGWVVYFRRVPHLFGMVFHESFAVIFFGALSMCNEIILLSIEFFKHYFACEVTPDVPL